MDGWRWAEMVQAPGNGAAECYESLLRQLAVLAGCCRWQRSLHAATWIASILSASLLLPPALIAAAFF